MLLCIWGVTPSQEYLQSFMNLIHRMLESYKETQFFDTMFSVQSVEGIPAYYYYSVLIYLYLLDDRTISNSPFRVLLDPDHLFFLRCMLAYCEIRRETILSSFVRSMNVIQMVE